MNRFVSALIIAAGVFAVASGAAQAQGWQLQYFPSDQKRSACMMRAEYNSGTEVGLVVWPSYDWGITLFNVNWNLREDASTDTAIYIDGRLVATSKFQHISKTLVYMPLDGARAFRSLQLGRTLNLRTPLGDLSYSLDGTSRAMSRVLACVKTLPNIPETSASQTAPSPKAFPVSQADAAITLTNLLNAASITGYELVPTRSQAEGMARYSMPNGDVGYLFVAKGADPNYADKLANGLVESGPESCPGDLTSGKQQLSTDDGSIVRKVVLACRTEARVMVKDSVIVRKSDGLLLWLTQEYDQSSRDELAEPNSATGASANALIDAAVRFRN